MTVSKPFPVGVLSRRWVPDPAGLLELWRHEAPRLLRAAAVFQDSDLGFQPSAGRRSVGELLAHLVDSYAVTRYWLSHNLPPEKLHESVVPTSVPYAIAQLQDSQRALFILLEDFPSSQFNVSIAPFGVLETRGVMALGMFKHELHHRGELHALAQVCGRKPPHLYQGQQEG